MAIPADAERNVSAPRSCIAQILNKNTCNDTLTASAYNTSSFKNLCMNEYSVCDSLFPTMSIKMTSAKSSISETIESATCVKVDHILKNTTILL